MSADQTAAETEIVTVLKTIAKELQQIRVEIANIRGALQAQIGRR